MKSIPCQVGAFFMLTEIFASWGLGRRMSFFVIEYFLPLSVVMVSFTSYSPGLVYLCHFTIESLSSIGVPSQ